MMQAAFHERLVYDRKAFEHDAQTLEVVQPCEGALDNPSCLAKATSVWLAATGDLRSNTGSVRWLAIFVMVVATIGLHDDRLRRWPSPFATDGRDRLDEWQ
ncbi:hypothetical protein WS70_24205 [Burkholderia mayonis]|uniref:Uncharacterized protein n=1 Tax=Burkholderia mayonis TaxID=1385591 RepID=A0A1B4FMF5_9BURK|nr:hypothetical protein WS70_24205 [Burkholderia mayonis]KVE43046.1 hypothetical protein WS70_10245 [Burkholderia mayonis]